MKPRFIVGLVLWAMCFLGTLQFAQEVNEGGVTIRAGRILNGEKSGRRFYGYSGAEFVFPRTNGGTLGFTLWNDQHRTRPSTTNYLTFIVADQKFHLQSYSTPLDLKEFFVEQAGEWGPGGGSQVRVEIPPGLQSLAVSNEGSETGIEISNVVFSESGLSGRPVVFDQAINTEPECYLAFGRVQHGAQTGTIFHGYSGGEIALPNRRGGVLSFRLWNDQHRTRPSTSNLLTAQVGERWYRFEQYTTPLDLKEYFSETPNEWGPAGGSVIRLQVPAGVARVGLSNPASETGFEISSAQFASGAQLGREARYEEHVNWTERTYNAFGRIQTGQNSRKQFYGYSGGVVVLPHRKGGRLRFTVWNDQHRTRPSTRNFIRYAFADIRQSVTLMTSNSQLGEFFVESPNEWGPAGGRLLELDIPPGVSRVEIGNESSDTGIEVSDTQFRSQPHATVFAVPCLGTAGPMAIGSGPTANPTPEIPPPQPPTPEIGPSTVATPELNPAPPPTPGAPPPPPISTTEIRPGQLATPEVGPAAEGTTGCAPLRFEVIQVEGGLKRLNPNKPHGILTLAANALRFQEQGRDVLGVYTSDIQEIGVNTVLGVKTAAFHVTLNSRTRYNFYVASLRPADCEAVVEALRRGLQCLSGAPAGPGTGGPMAIGPGPTGPPTAGITPPQPTTPEIGPSPVATPELNPAPAPTPGAPPPISTTEIRPGQLATPEVAPAAGGTSGCASLRFEVIHVEGGLKLLNPNKPHGILTLAGNALRYQERGRDVLGVYASDIKEIGVNKLLGVKTASFHIILNPKTTHNFYVASLNPADCAIVVDALQRTLQCMLGAPTGAAGAHGCGDPRTLEVMDEWLARALPPQQPGESLHYEAWGRLVGRSRTANLSVPGKPDTTLSRCEWLLQLAPQLGSTNLGTLGEYLDQRLR